MYICQSGEIVPDGPKACKNLKKQSEKKDEKKEVQVAKVGLKYEEYLHKKIRKVHRNL